MDHDFVVDDGDGRVLMLPAGFLTLPENLFAVNTEFYDPTQLPGHNVLSGVYEVNDPPLAFPLVGADHVSGLVGLDLSGKSDQLPVTDCELVQVVAQVGYRPMVLQRVLEDPPSSNITLVNTSTVASIASSSSADLLTAALSSEPHALVKLPIEAASVTCLTPEAGAKQGSSGKVTVSPLKSGIPLGRSGTFSKARRKVIPKKKVVCHSCGKEFNKNFDYRQHLRTHTGEKPFMCIVCGQAFAQKSNVKKHLLTHLVWNPQLNPDDIGTGGHLPQSTLDGKSMDKGFECRFCQVPSMSCYSEYRQHLKTHAEEKVFECILPGCPETTATVEEFLLHVKIHEALKFYRCEQCSAEFFNLYQFSFHNWAHRGDDKEVLIKGIEGISPIRFHKCEICQRKFAHPQELKQHRESVDHLYQCPHCPTKFSQERYLRRHLVVHSETSNFLCELCGKAFKLKHHLASHVLLHSNKAFKCNQCKSSFFRKDQLRRHQKSVHVANSFKCETCGKLFSRPDKLKEHIRFRATRCAPLSESDNENT